MLTLHSANKSVIFRTIDKIKIVRICLAALLTGIILLLDLDDQLALCAFILPYLIIGYDVLFDAINNIIHGRFFDEKFLMMISTIGALCVGEYSEAVSVMLFYQAGELFQTSATRKSHRTISELITTSKAQPNFQNCDFEMLEEEHCCCKHDIAEVNSGKIETFLTRFSRYYTPCVVFGALLLAIVAPLLFSQPWDNWIERALVFLVVACPCALVISIPLSFSGGIAKSSKRGILFKSAVHVENLSKVHTLIIDNSFDNANDNVQMNLNVEEAFSTFKKVVVFDENYDQAKKRIVIHELKSELAKNECLAMLTSSSDFVSIDANSETSFKSDADVCLENHSEVDVLIVLDSCENEALVNASSILISTDIAGSESSVVSLTNAAMLNSRRTMSIVYQNIVLSLGIKVIVLILGALGITNMWIAVFGDVGVLVIAILNAMRALS